MFLAHFFYHLRKSGCNLTTIFKCYQEAKYAVINKKNPYIGCITLTFCLRLKTHNPAFPAVTKITCKQILAQDREDPQDLEVPCL